MRLVTPPKITGRDLNEHEWECDWAFWGSSSLLSSPHLFICKSWGYWFLSFSSILSCLPPFYECCEWMLHMKSLGPTFCWKWTYQSVMRGPTILRLLLLLLAGETRDIADWVSEALLVGRPEALLDRGAWGTAGWSGPRHCRLGGAWGIVGWGESTSITKEIKWHEKNNSILLVNSPSYLKNSIFHCF